MEERFVQIGRDPFARVDRVRRIVDDPTLTCSWCGNKRRRGNLFNYGVWPDSVLGMRISWDNRAFCSLSCRNVYYM